MIQRSASVSPTQGKIAAIAMNGVAVRDSTFSLDGLVGQAPLPSLPTPASINRHDVADGGKTMPPSRSREQAADDDDDRPENRRDTAIIWLPVPLAATRVVDPVGPVSRDASITTNPARSAGVADNPPIPATLQADAALDLAASTPNTASPAILSRPSTSPGDANVLAAQALELTTASGPPAISNAGLTTDPSLPVLTTARMAPALLVANVFADPKFSLGDLPTPTEHSVNLASPIGITDSAIASCPTPLAGPAPLTDPLSSLPTVPALAATTSLPVEQATAIGGGKASIANTPVVQTLPIAPIPLAPSHQAVARVLDGAAPRPIEITRDDASDDASSVGLTAAAMPATIATAVAASQAAQRVPLNLAHDVGLQRMIDHIELLRDDADAHDTRIRLAPDALGTVDVAVRKQGDSIHVHFTAQHDATRIVLAEAQQRLSDLATARGVKLSGTSVDVGGQGGGNGNAPPQTAFARPASASARRTGRENTESTDQRLA